MAMVRMDFEQAEIDEKDKIMLRYAEKLTVEPWNMTVSDVDKLRAVGFTDVDVLDINQITAYYAYVNRTADGLGVALEDFWHK